MKVETFFFFAGIMKWDELTGVINLSFHNLSLSLLFLFFLLSVSSKGRELKTQEEKSIHGLIILLNLISIKMKLIFFLQ